MGMLIHGSPTKLLTMSNVIPRIRKERSIQHISTLLKNEVGCPWRILSVTAFEIYSAPSLESKGWKTQHNAKEILISASSYESNS